MTYLNATVKYGPGKILDTTNGPRINAVLTLENHQEIKLWGDPGEPGLAQLRKGQRVQVSQDGSKYALVANSHDAFGGGAAPAGGHGQAPASIPGHVPAARPDPWSKEHVDEINLAIARRAWVMRRCHDEILKNFTEPETGQVVIDDETKRTLMATLYIDLKGIVGA